jgi:hypothetical protein
MIVPAAVGDGPVQAVRALDATSKGASRQRASFIVAPIMKCEQSDPLSRDRRSARKNHRSPGGGRNFFPVRAGATTQ